MTILGYSEIMRYINGHDEYIFENTMVSISKSGLSQIRLKVLQKLASEKRSTITQLLALVKENSTGGTHLTINKFFCALEKESIIEKSKIGNRTYWQFTPQYEQFRKYLENQFI